MTAGSHNSARALAVLIAVAGLVLPSSLSTGYPQIRRFHPTVTLTQCQRAGGVVQATRGTSEVCTGGADDGDPVVGE